MMGPFVERLRQLEASRVSIAEALRRSIAEKGSVYLNSRNFGPKVPIGTTLRPKYIEIYIY